MAEEDTTHKGDKTSWFKGHPATTKVIAIFVAIAIVGASLLGYFYLNRNKDSDHDGLSDKLEKKYGLDPHNASDANADFDHDLVSNKEEILYYYSNITNPNSPFPGNSDYDGDYVIRSIEIENGLDPGTKYSFGGLHDFLRLYGYTERIPNNVSFEDMLNNATKYEPRYWTLKDGGYEHYRTNIYSKLTLADPIFRYYANKVHIDWENSSTYGEVGHLKLGDENLFLEYGTTPNKPLVPPSYYLTHGRKGICVESSVANDCIFQYKGYPSTLMGGDTPQGNHSWGEVIINNNTYISNFNVLFSQKLPDGTATYTKLNWTIDSFYDSNWYTNGTDRHM